MRKKKCKNPGCGKEFFSNNTLQKVCSPQCAADLAKVAKEKARRKRDRAKLQELKSLSQLLKEAQTEFNAFIRYRDRDDPCISCGRYHNGQYHAGHYRTVGANPELRFSELNCHKQCSACNNHKSGDISNYRPSLLAKIGEKDLAWVEGPHQSQNWTREDAVEIKKYYRDKLRELKKRD